MKLHNEFVVPLPPKRAFELLNDVEAIAPCFPGATLQEAKGDGSYAGSMAMRLGPVALTFQGTASFEHVDEEALKVRAKANGNEKRARGGARADVEFQVVPDSDGSRVHIDTDLQLVGSIAQYARGSGMIETTAQVMIDQFAANLQAKLAHERAPASDEVPQGPFVAVPQEPPRQTSHAEPALEAGPPSLLRILWLALKRRLSAGAGR